MKQMEADAIAKAIRNRTKVPIGYKTELVDAFCAVMVEQDQFFNVKRFRDFALMELDPGWPNQVDAHYKKDRM